MWSITVSQIDGSETVIYSGTQLGAQVFFNLYKQWNSADKNDRPAWVVPDLIITNEIARELGRWGKPVKLIDIGQIIVGTIQ